MSHYYINDEKLNEEIKKINVKIKDVEFTFNTQSGVFSKSNIDFGSKLLIENIVVDPNVENIADIGCGYGPIGLSLAKFNPYSHIFMYDINQRAVNLAINNAKLNNINNVTIKNNNILDNITTNFDLIVTNPPIRAGKEIVFKIYEQAYQKLKEQGKFYCVIQKKQGAPSSYKKLTELFKNVQVITKSKGYWIIFAQK